MIIMRIISSMRKRFKNYFVPHDENDHRPHLLKLEAGFYILSIIIFLEVLFLIGAVYILPQTDFFALVLPDVLVDQTNDNRQNASAPVLNVNPLLAEAARLKAEDMAQKGYFAHTSPDGKVPWHWLSVVGYRYRAAGENLAVNFIDSSDVMNAWMNSPTHRDNILNKRYAEIGIATARGVYQGREAVFVVQFFGEPSALALAQAPPPATESVPVPLPAGETVAAAEAVEEIPGIKDSPRPPEEQQSSIEVTEVSEFIPEGLGAGGVGVSSEFGTKIPVKQASWAEKLLAHPRVVVNSLFLILLAVISLALLLNVFIRFHIQHPELIARGVLTVIIIISAFFLNGYVAVSQASIF